MAMYKVIKEIKEDEYTYRLGYYLLKDEVYPRIEIYRDKKLFAGSSRSYRTYADSFYFDANYSSAAVHGAIGTMKEMFTRLREYSKISEEVEKEYEKIYLLYKLNNFKEI